MNTKYRIPVSFTIKNEIRLALLCDESEWIHDDQRNACILCKSKFNFINRKHHCRLCGEIICGLCCQYLSYHQKNYIRGCKKCIEISCISFTSKETILSTPFTLQTTPHPLFIENNKIPSIFHQFYPWISLGFLFLILFY